MEETNALEAPEVFTGLAAKIDTEITNLIAARGQAVEFESGLATKTDINSFATAIRANLLEAKKNIHRAYKDTFSIKGLLLDNVGTVQAKAKKAALKAKIAEMNAALKALA